MTGRSALGWAAPAVIAVLRAGRTDRFVAVAEVLYGAGVRDLEVTLTSPGAPAAVAAIRAALPGDARLAVGTVRTAADVGTACRAGAAYLVTPHTCREVLAAARTHGVPVVAGALTPTEIDAAWRAGAAAVKVFPAGTAGGAGYLSAVRAPLPEIPLVPSGGIGVQEVGGYLRAGAAAVGVGGPLLGDAAEPGGDLGALADRARAAVASALAAAG